MGIKGFLTNFFQHDAIKPIIKNELIEPLSQECLLIDYNNVIHTVINRVILDFNEILYYLYFSDKNISKNHKISFQEFIDNMVFSEKNILILMNNYNKDYHIGSDYNKWVFFTKSKNFISMIQQEIINATHVLLNKLCFEKTELIYIVVDGVPSIAKINNSRNRKFINSYINNIKKKITFDHKFKKINIYQIDENILKIQLTRQKMTEYICEKLRKINYPVKIIVSDLSENDEGEKKIIRFIKKNKQINDFHVFSPDSDMCILLFFLNIDDEFRKKNIKISCYGAKYKLLIINEAINALIDYYSKRIKKNITVQSIKEIMFMTFIMGNDFLPKIEPFDMSFFDVFVDCCCDHNHTLINNFGQINYEYILSVFENLNKYTKKFFCENYMTSTYKNYYYLKNLLSITNSDVKKYNNYILNIVDIDYRNIQEYIEKVKSYIDIINNTIKSVVVFDKIYDLYENIIKKIDGVYCLVVYNKIFFYNEFKNLYDVYNKIIIVCINDKITDILQVLNLEKKICDENICDESINNISGISIDNNMKSSKTLSTAYKSQLQVFENMKSIYTKNIDSSPIQIIYYDHQNSKYIDDSLKYYHKYIDKNISQHDIREMISDYITGIEWLFKSYILGYDSNFSGWYYKYNIAPLLSDIIEYLNSGNYESTIEKKISIESPIFNSQEYFNMIYPDEYTNAKNAPSLNHAQNYIDGYGAKKIIYCKFFWNKILE